MSRSKALFFLCLSFIGGLFISSFQKVPGLIIFELLVLGVFYGSVFFKQKAILIFAFCLLALALGLWQGNTASPLDDSFQQQNSGYLQPLKQRFQAVINKNLSPPQGAVLSAVVLGNKRELSQDFKEDLNRSGLRHITAVSGMHIVILSGILMWLGIALGLWRGQAFYLAIGLLWLFILMIGSAPSAVRAGIMGSIFLLAEKVGRQKTADRALILTAAVMLAVDPSLLRHSIGFQLSFLATLGIIYLMPIFQNWLNKIKFLKTANISSLLAMSLAAQIFVLPLLVYYFGQFSIVSPITNLLVVPCLPYLMVLGLVFVVLGAFWLPLSLILLFPAWLTLSYITKITKLFSAFSFSTLQFSIHWLWLPVIYALLFALIWRARKRQQLKALP